MAAANAQQPAQLGVAEATVDPAPFDFSAMRPPGSLARLPRSLMFQHPQRICQLVCCSLTTTYSQDHKLKGDRRLVGVELKQAQLAQQRSDYSKVLKRLRPLKAAEQSSFGGHDFPAVKYPAVSVGAQLLQQVDYACFAGASKQQLDELRTGAETLIHPSTLPRLKDCRPYEYQPVNFNATHLKVTLREYRFDDAGQRVMENEKHSQTRGSTTSWDLYQKVVCCLTAGQVVSERKDILTRHALSSDAEVRAAFEAIKYYSFKGVGKQAFKYEDAKDDTREFYEEAMKPDGAYTTETHLREQAEKLWRKSISYDAKCDNKSESYRMAKVEREMQANNDLEKVTHLHNRLYRSLKRVVADLQMDSVDGIKNLDAEHMIHWHSVITGSNKGFRVAGQPIDGRNRPGNKKARAEAIYHDINAVLGHAIEDDDGEESD